jgi:hypothetical protein
MPGSYAHIALVNLASEKQSLLQIDGFPREAIDVANLHVNFLELGAISPDYPYLNIASADSKKWADAMHYTHTCRTISVGAQLVYGLPKGIARDKCLAWLMGYSAHVFTDMCIHPVVELKVGPYNGNEMAHRRCEMHQDAYIFRRIGTGMPQTSDHINATIMTCGDSNNPNKLDADVKKLWESVLRTVHTETFVADPPDMNTWHKRCREILEKLLPTSSELVGFARHVCDGLGFAYPTPDKIDRQEYIDSLKVPAPAGTEKRMNYDDIFDFAIKQVQQAWIDVTRSALSREITIAYADQEWDLDTGRNKLDSSNKRVFWGVA